MNTFAETEASIRHLLQYLKPSFTDSEIAEVCQFLDVGEYGVALETLLFIATEEKKAISSKQYDLIDEIGRRMHMDPVLWSHLRPS